jgi:hypothetical protein
VRLFVVDVFTLSPFEFFVLRTRTRFPFRYGIASMTDVPHLFVRTTVMSSGRSAVGVAAEGLPPKWFTKNPATTFEQDLPEMLESIGHAADLAAEGASQSIGFFDLWRELNRQQFAWAAARGMPTLVAGLGVALVERATLDGLCRLMATPLHQMIAENRLGLRMGEIYAELRDVDVNDLLPRSPLDACYVRHTIGLADALSAGELTPHDRVDDGLPQDLESSIRAYGLRYFKIKLSGMPDRDLPRLADLARILERETGGQFYVTVDGNENFISFDEFKDLWDRIATRAALKELCRRTIVVEQPVHRDRALLESTGEELSGWPDRPPLIIDESDGAIGDVPLALDLGYAGASYKNCKGIVKGIANACLLAARRRQGKAGVLTGEDLCNLGPLPLQQDLVMMAILGIEHVERNGHHYYRGLSMFPRDWQDALLRTHDDFYALHVGGFAHLRIENGRISLASLNRAPFGVEPQLDVTAFAPLERTQFARIS